MSNNKVTINLVVLNGAKYIRYCLDGILAQTYPHELIELNVLDNGSTDGTISEIENFKLKIKNSSFADFRLIKNQQNLGMWPGQEELLKHSNGKYVLAMAVDVILDKDFIKNSVGRMDNDPRVGALQAKIYKYDSDSISNSRFVIPDSRIIDTCGFKIFRSRRLINIGHGEEDKGQYDDLGRIFGVEGAAPFFRREAIDNIRIKGEFADHDYFWYGDDFDIAWRLNILGWDQVFEPSVIAWHDRQTTKKMKKNLDDFKAIRSSIPLSKRRLEWKNIRFTIIKNDYIINILKDLPYILARELKMLSYLVIFEPGVLSVVPEFIKIIPGMFQKRSIIMRKAVRSPEEIHKWFT